MRGHPNRLKTFVANRMSDIMKRGNITQWRQVSGKDNPADCATRGLDTSSLQSHHLWWHGPSWLSKSKETWPMSIPNLPETVPELKATVLSTCTEENRIDTLINSHSSLTSLIRIMAFLKRFLHNAKFSSNRRKGPLNVSELNSSLQTIITHVQRTTFNFEFNNLLNKP